MSYLQFIQTSPGDMVDLIDQRMEKRFQKFLQDLQRQKDNEELLTIEQTCKFLKIDQSTLWRWTNKGKVKAYAISGKRYYKRSEIMEGYRLYQEEPIHISGNIVKKVTPEDIFKYTLKYVESFDDADLEAAFITRGETLLLRNKAIVISLPECEFEFLRDTQSRSYKFYKQGILIVEADKKFDIIPYEKANGLVWEERIINREFKLFNEDELEMGIFAQFVQNITNNEEHFDSVSSAIGYMLHSFKDQRKPIAIIINDENLIDEGKPEGGTGKGLLVKGVSQIIEKAAYNGKNSDFSNNKFAYQNVSETTDLLFIDDAPKNFKFEALFSVLTEDLPVERKHQPLEMIPFELSPKFVITTNYTINGSSSSYKRRRFDIFLNNFYHSGHTPADDFGNEFFHGWDEKEWQLFDYYMMECLRMFLSFGLKAYSNDDWALKMLKNETSPDFVVLMDQEFAEKNTTYSYGSVREQLISSYGEKYTFHNKDYKITIEWVERYASFKGLNLHKSRQGSGSTFMFL